MGDHRCIRGAPSEFRSLADAHGFTPGEENVFDLLLRGKPDSCIAHRLQITEAAVRSRCREIMRKLNARNRVELMERARQWDLAISRLLS